MTPFDARQVKRQRRGNFAENDSVRTQETPRLIVLLFAISEVLLGDRLTKGDDRLMVTDGGWLVRRDTWEPRTVTGKSRLPSVRRSVEI